MYLAYEYLVVMNNLVKYKIIVYLPTFLKIYLQFNFCNHSCINFQLNFFIKNPGDVEIL